MINIILVEPRIPQNTGNIGRLCVASGAKLHLIHPLGFHITQKQLKRAGMDYWEKLEVFQWKNLQDFWEQHPFSDEHFLFSTTSKQNYYDAKFKNPSYLYFGREDAGLDKNLLKTHLPQVYKIPMRQNIRSINLATSVGIVLYEAIRQTKIYQNF